jgi:hypothetical protein
MKKLLPFLLLSLFIWTCAKDEINISNMVGKYEGILDDEWYYFYSDLDTFIFDSGSVYVPVIVNISYSGNDIKVEDDSGRFIQILRNPNDSIIDNDILYYNFVDANFSLEYLEYHFANDSLVLFKSSTSPSQFDDYRFTRFNGTKIE